MRANENADCHLLSYLRFERLKSHSYKKMAELKLVGNKEESETRPRKHSEYRPQRRTPLRPTQGAKRGRSIGGGNTQDVLIHLLRTLKIIQLFFAIMIVAIMCRTLITINDV